MSISAYTSIITLNKNGLNAPIKRHRVAEWIQKQNPHTCCLQETHFRVKDTYRLKVRDERRQVFHANGNEKKGRVAILILDNKVFRRKTVTRDKEHYITIKESIQRTHDNYEYIRTKHRQPNYIKQILGGIKKFTVTQ